MTKHHFIILLFLLSLICLLPSCKKSDNNFYEYSSPDFAVFQIAGEPESIYAYCTSHDVFMDSIYVTSPLNIKSRQYFHGQVYAMNQHFLMGNNFVPHAGTWQFIIYGRKTVNGMAFTVYTEREF
ncbi:MAG: hypothetical protein IMY74_04205 [Bacteroidetes bacterium]|nr:hypothetical protein [Bacteroidota bacterium]MCK5765918.1 hypothetical protein [Bacteroidales bacterium]